MGYYVFQFGYFSIKMSSKPGEFFENQFNQSTQDPTLFLLTHAC